MISRTSKAQLVALCPGHDTQDGALSEALEALWAVRVLDNYSEKYGVSTPAPIRTNDPKVTSCFVVWSMNMRAGHIYGATQDAARIAVAKVLVADDWTLSPKGWS